MVAGGMPATSEAPMSDFWQIMHRHRLDIGARKVPTRRYYLKASTPEEAVAKLKEFLSPPDLPEFAHDADGTFAVSPARDDIVLHVGTFYSDPTDAEKADRDERKKKRNAKGIK